MTASGLLFPLGAGTVALAVTGTTANVALALNGAISVAVTNAGTAIAFVKLGASGITAAVPTGVGASAGDYPVLPGCQVMLDRGGATTLAAITAGGTTTLYVTTGDGE